ncbi:MAG TPA: acetyl-CoA carboxylase biotin carboxylase subunit [Egibacteraceae bacterium]|nr:acetyl-CoA carboxylase biotin carboxylase subunit [Egibacteraceae bacterium]
MVSAVLVANRGEIALRVVRACADLGLTSIAVYSEADRDAPWIRAADQAYLLGPTPPADSYLSIARILDVAQRSGADTIHPGYGFLSESVEFAEAVVAAGLTWVGPPPSAMLQMGDKLSARKVAEAASVPVVPGTLEPTTDPETVSQFAQQHGYPVAVKAAFGGGGRGLKVIRSESELAEALEAAQREALAAFGRGEVYVERYLTRPRHIEVQILADAHGACVSLGERDCSTQRRHQKLIEEAPAPDLDDDVRRAMSAAAVRLAAAVGYTGAGTLEFLYEDGRFYFLEMNTRLQVEHPVTEAVTGLDLVAWQLRIAAGEQLTFAPDDIAPRGHAIEARINAEHVAGGFAPSPGLITAFHEPSGPGIRVDAGAEAGFEIPAAYDSLIAKLIAHGADRDEARRRLLRALAEFTIEGVPTTIDFHRFALAHPDFVDARMSTVTVEREWDLSDIAPAAAPDEGLGPRRPSRTMTVEVAGKRLEVALFEEQAPGSRRPRRTGATGSRARAGGGPAVEELVAPMQGTVVKTAVAEGQHVGAGDLVLVLEAMKMENHVTAHRDGIVAALHVEAGDVVKSGALLARIEGAGDSPADDPREAADGEAS